MNDVRANPGHPEHTTYVESLKPAPRLLHDIYCACGHGLGPTSLRHPLSDDQVELVEAMEAVGMVVSPEGWKY